MKEVDESVGQPLLLNEGIHRELLMQASDYRDKCRGREVVADCPSVDFTDVIRQVLKHCADLDKSAALADKGMADVSVPDFLEELGKGNSALAKKLKPLLSRVTSIGVDGDDIELRFNFKDVERGQPQWQREGTLAADITTHGLFIPKVLRAHFVEDGGRTKLAGLKGLEVPVTVTDVPINIDRIVLRSTRISLCGDRLQLDIESKNPAPFLSKFLPAHKRRPDPVSSVVLVDDKGNLEMYESWRKDR